MAEGILKKIGEENKWRVAVRSAGTNTVNGLPASDNAIAVMKEKSIDITQHRSHQITGEMLSWADIIITMGQSHQEYLKQNMPEKVILTLYECAKAELGDICDPWGSNLKVYRACANEIELLIKQIVDEGTLP